jgi:hypothetical protein
MFPTHENIHSMAQKHCNIIYTSETTQSGMWVPREEEKKRNHFHPFSQYNEFLSNILQK